MKSGTAKKFSLEPANRRDKIGLNFTGYISIPTDGIYTFYSASDDGSKIYIGDRLVVIHDGLHGMSEKDGQVALKAGKHAITVPFFENVGAEGLRISYSGPGIKKQEVPAKVLFRKK